MPWLRRAMSAPFPQPGEPGLLHVHVPLCGGTSLQQAFEVQKQAMELKSWLGRLGIRYFYYRYRLYEETSFPWQTWENVWALVAFSLAFVMWLSLQGYANTCVEEGIICHISVVPYLLTLNSFFCFVFSTFVCTPPALRSRLPPRAPALRSPSAWRGRSCASTWTRHG